jgi:uncharacterized protein (TIGR02246 family)
MRKLQLLLVVMIAVLTAAPVIAGPVEDANAVVDRWATTFSINDPDELTKIYWPDASLLGTTSPVMSEGTEGILKYFLPLKGSGFKCVIGERRAIALGDGAVVVAGFYEFSRLQDGKTALTPARFTILVVKRDGVWRIAHHHSSPHVQPKN